MNKTFKILGLAVLSAAMFTSCTSDSSGIHQTSSGQFDSNKLIMGVKSINSSSDYNINSAPVVGYNADWMTNQMSFTLYNLITPSNNTVNITTPVMTCEFNNNLQVEVKPTTIAVNGVTLENFHFLGYFAYSTSYIPMCMWMSMTFTIDSNEYVINSFVNGVATGYNTALTYTGQLTTFTEMDPTGFTWEGAGYVVSFDTNNMLADVIFSNIKFAYSMPEMGISLNKIPFTMGPNGYQLVANEIIPVTISDKKERPEYVIKNFSAMLPYDGIKGTMNFECSEANWPVQVTNLVIYI